MKKVIKAIAKFITAVEVIKITLINTVLFVMQIEYSYMIDVRYAKIINLLLCEF